LGEKRNGDKNYRGFWIWSFFWENRKENTREKGGERKQYSSSRANVAGGQAPRRDRGGSKRSVAYQNNWVKGRLHQQGYEGGKICEGQKVRTTGKISERKNENPQNSPNQKKRAIASLRILNKSLGEDWRARV